MAYDHLFSPITVGTMQLPHRIVMQPHAGFGDAGDKPGTRSGQYFAERAKNGAAWIVTGLAVAHPHLLPRGATRGGWDDSARPAIETILSWIKPYGAYLTSQLSHSGHNGPGADNLRPNWSASQTPSPFNLDTPMAIRKTEIESVVDYFGKTARSFKAAGLDGVEIQTAGDYLVGSFLSPPLNQRTDDYGGSLENRARIVVDILRRIREEVGQDFTLGIRTSGTRLIRGFDDVDDCVAFCGFLAGTGLIDFISVMYGSYYDHGQFGPSMRVPRGNAVGVAAKIRAVAGIPVIATGRLDDPALADAVIAAGSVDLAGIARGLLADPAWIQKVREGRLEDVRPCITCNHCNARLHLRKEGQCAVNPQMGQEAKLGDDTLTPVETSRRIVVVGGGPAGMEAARIAALRGHRVTLYEAGDRLGGQIAIAALAPHRQDLGRIVQFQKTQLAKLGVEIVCGTSVTADHPALADADRIVVATGSTPEREGVSLFYPGYGPIDAGDGSRIVTSWEALTAPETPGNTVLVYDEDLTQAGPSVALHLAEAGKIVHIATTAVQLGLPELERTSELHQTLEDLLHVGVTIHPLTAVRRAERGRVALENVLTQQQHDLAVDTVVLVTGYRSNSALLDALLESGRPAVGVGDCVAPRRLIMAIHEGFQAGWNG